MEVNQIFKQSQLSQTFLKLQPLVVNYLIENVLLNERDKIMHLLAKELKPSQLLRGFGWQSLKKLVSGTTYAELRKAKLFPEIFEAVFCSLDFQYEEKDAVVLL